MAGGSLPTLPLCLARSGWPRGGGRRGKAPGRARIPSLKVKVGWARESLQGRDGGVMPGSESAGAYVCGPGVPGYQDPIIASCCLPAQASWTGSPRRCSGWAAWSCSTRCRGASSRGCTSSATSTKVGGGWGRGTSSPFNPVTSSLVSALSDMNASSGRWPAAGSCWDVQCGEVGCPIGRDFGSSADLDPLRRQWASSLGRPGDMGGRLCGGGDVGLGTEGVLGLAGTPQPP